MLESAFWMARWARPGLDMPYISSGTLQQMREAQCISAAPQVFCCLLIALASSQMQQRHQADGVGFRHRLQIT